MEIGVWTGFLWEMSPEEMVRVFAREGWHTLELSAEHAALLLRRGDPAKTGAAFRAYAADHGVAFPQGHFWLPPGLEWDTRQPMGIDLAPADDALFESRMEAMKGWVELFAALGIAAGVYHHGGYDLAKAGWPPERVTARRREGIARVCGYARGAGVKVCIENLPGETALYEALRPLVEFLPFGEAWVCLDTGHANRAGGSCADFARAAGPRLAALHLHDSIGPEHDHIFPYGKGTVAWDPLIAALREIAYTGLFAWEVPRETRCPLDVRLLKLAYLRDLTRWMLRRNG